MLEPETTVDSANSPSGPPSAPPSAPRRGRRWAIGGASLLALLVVARVAAPSILGSVIESRLSEALAAPASVGGVDLRLWAGEATIHELRVAPVSASASTVRIGESRVHWRWLDLLGGDTPLDFEVSDVAVTLDLEAPWPATPARPEGAGLGPLRSLTLRDGHFEVIPTRDAAPIVVLDDVHGTLREGAWGARGAAMTTQVRLAATTGTDGRLAVTAALSPVQPAAAWTVHVELDRLELRPLNPLVKQALEMSVERGTLSVSSDLTTTDGRMRGYLTPRFEQLMLLAPGERVRHPMAEALFGSMLASTDQPIEIDRPTGGPGGGLAVRLDAAFRTDALELLRRVVLRGFTRRLDSLIGHDATIGGLEVDFPAGLLAFTDVTLRKTDGTAAAPFLHVARLEVIVEPSLVDRDVQTYKAVVLHAPHFSVIVDATEAGSQHSIDPDWQAKVSALPFPTDSLRIVDGQVEYDDRTTEPPSHLVVSGIEVEAEDLARGAEEPDARGAHVSASALVVGEAPLKVEADYAPGGEALDGELRVTLAPVGLVRFNGLLRDRFGIDVSSGSLGLTAVLDARGGKITGTLTPELDDVIVLGSREEDVTHPLRELIVGRRLRKLDGVHLQLELGPGPDLLQQLPGALLRAVREAR